MTTDPDPEQALVERCLSGDESAWEEMAKAYTRRVYAICYRFTSSDSQSQDLTQEVFLASSAPKELSGWGGLVHHLATRLTRNF
jgi:RNA polymerase sigma-70 factor (ECF subfamily)